MSVNVRAAAPTPRGGRRAAVAGVCAAVALLLLALFADRWARPPGTGRLTRGRLRAAIATLREGTTALLVLLDDGVGADLAAAEVRLLDHAAAAEALLGPDRAHEPGVTQPGPTAVAYVRDAVAAIRAGTQCHDRAALERALWYLDAAERPGLPVVRPADR